MSVIDQNVLDEAFAAPFLTDANDWTDAEQAGWKGTKKLESEPSDVKLGREDWRR